MTYIWISHTKSLNPTNPGPVIGGLVVGSETWYSFSQRHTLMIFTRHSLMGWGMKGKLRLAGSEPQWSVSLYQYPRDVDTCETSVGSKNIWNINWVKCCRNIWKRKGLRLVVGWNHWGVGVGDPSNNQLGSSVGECFTCDEVVPGSIPGLAYSFLFLQEEWSGRNGRSGQGACLITPQRCQNVLMRLTFP